MNAPLLDTPATAQSARGRFITFEGGEGAGKSTQVRLLTAHLEKAGLHAIATREPGGTSHAEALRAALLSGRAAELGAFGEAVLFGAARIDHIDKLIAPALASGAWVVCDRFADSTRAYQGAAGKAKPELIATLERIVLGPIKPDLTFLLDLDPQAGLSRARLRAGEGAVDRFEGEKLEFHRALRAAFLDIARKNPARVRVIDATLAAEEIADRVWMAARETFAPALEGSAA